jgi:hypothetical protein
MQRFEVIDLALELAERIDERTQPRNLFDVALRLVAIVPEIGRGHARLEFA